MYKIHLCIKYTLHFLQMTTKCDVIRDSANAIMCGLCGEKKSPSCGNIPDAVCTIPGANNVKMRAFALKYKPGSSPLKTQEERVFGLNANLSKEKLLKAYPGLSDADADIGWQDYEECLWSKEGGPGGPFGNKYFKRNDVFALGMQPPYPIGGKTAENAVWKNNTSPIPILFDYVMNPSLLAIVIFVFLVFIYVIIVIAYIKDKNAAKRAVRH